MTLIEGLTLLKLLE